MPSSFPLSLNNFEALTTADIPVNFGKDNVSISAADMARLWAACQATGYVDPNGTGYGVKFTLIHPTALDGYGRLIDPSKTCIIVAFFGDPAANPSNLLDIRLAYDAGSGYGYGYEGVAPATLPAFPIGSYLRSEMTSGVLVALYKAINLLEAAVGTHLPP